MKFLRMLKTIFLGLFLIITESSWAHDLPPIIKIQNNTSETAHVLTKTQKHLSIHTIYPLSYKYIGNPFLIGVPLEMRQLIINFDPDPPQIQSSQNLLDQLPKNKLANSCYWFDFQEGKFIYLGVSKAKRINEKFLNLYFYLGVNIQNYIYVLSDQLVTGYVDCGKAPGSNKFFNFL